MSAPLAFAGTYSSFALIKTRSTFALTIEFPIEEAEKIIAAFGVPQPGAERPVAVALLNPSAPSESVRPVVDPPVPGAREPSEATQAPSQAEGGKVAAREKGKSDGSGGGPGGVIPGPLSSGARAVQMAGILANDEGFQKWLWHESPDYGEYRGQTWVPDQLPKDAAEWEEWTAKRVRRMCGVISRRELATDELARARFHALEVAFRQATGQMAVDHRA